jgi:hypothetical protein
MGAYPTVISELLTLEAAIAGVSLARYGDGELRVALGRGCVSQTPDPGIAAELRAILQHTDEGLLACIPNTYGGTPKKESWERFSTDGYTKMYGMKAYGSSFITRPDSAPWIDNPEYWERVTHLWRDRDVVLVVGDKKSLRVDGMLGAKSIREVHAPSKNAWAEVDRIEEEIGRPSGSVLMCLGCTATALAARLSKKGVHAVDTGHIGMFMRHAGIYGMGLDHVTTNYYRGILQQMHKVQKWGGNGARHVEEVKRLIERVHGWKGGLLEKVTVLDYGCGRGTLAEALKPHRCQQYDPGIVGKDVLPKPSDIVVCTDVLEHVEPGKVDAVIEHIRRLTGKLAYLVISTRDANAVLPDGRNAHLLVHPPEWWVAKLVDPRWEILSCTQHGEPTAKEVRITLRKLKG